MSFLKQCLRSLSAAPSSITNTNDRPSKPALPIHLSALDRRHTGKLTTGQAHRQREGDRELIAASEDAAVKRLKQIDDLNINLLREQVNVAQVRNTLRAHQSHIVAVQDASDAQTHVHEKQVDGLTVKLLREQVNTARFRSILHAQRYASDQKSSVFDYVDKQLKARLVHMQARAELNATSDDDVHGSIGDGPDDEVPVLPFVEDDQDDGVDATDEIVGEHDAYPDNGAFDTGVPDGAMLAEHAGWWGLLAVGSFLFIYRT